MNIMPELILKWQEHRINKIIRKCEAKPFIILADPGTTMRDRMLHIIKDSEILYNRRKCLKCIARDSCIETHRG